MTARTLRILLGASVALNLFAAAAGATLLIARTHVEGGIEAQRRPPRDHPFMAVVEGLDPEVRDRVRDELRASGRAAHPDFEEARRKRRQALTLARSPDFDPTQAAALLEQSRAAELRGRARIEADSIRILETLEPDDRAALSEILTRRGRMVVRERDERRQRRAGA